MPSQHPEEVGYGHVVESYVTRMYGGLPRYLVLNGGRFLGPRWWHTTRFTRHLLSDAVAISDEELEALLGYEWRSTCSWPARSATPAVPTASPWPASARTRTPRSSPPTSTATSPRTDLHYDQPAALGALLRLDALLGTHHADRFTEPDGLWDEWVKGVGRLGYPSHTPAEQRRWTDLQCDFTNGWSRA